MTTATLDTNSPAARSSVPDHVPDHAHHWVIEEANGPNSAGVCKRCGEVRSFKNWLEEADFITGEERRSAA